MKQRLAKKLFLSFLCVPLLLGTLTSTPALAEEQLPAESVSATPSPIPSDSIAPTVTPEEESIPSAEPTSAPSVNPEPSSSPSLTLSPDPTALPTPQDDFRLIVTFNATENKSEQVATLSNLDNADLVKSEELMKNTSVLIASGNEAEAIKELNDAPGVKTVTVDRLNTFSREPNDEKASVVQQYHLGTWESNYGINARSAWDVTTGSSEVNVAVIDTGKIEHPDLVGKWLPGWDFVQGDNNPTDPGLTPGDKNASGWHGTLIAGVVAAKTNNSIGIAGVNWNAKITPVRTGGGDGSYTSNMILGIRWAAGLRVAGTTLNPNPAEVINVSMGSEDYCPYAVQEAIDDAVEAGSLVVVAAGNEDRSASDISPANCDNVVTVGATNQSGDIAGFSNYGSDIDLMAPGVGILSTSCLPKSTCTNTNHYEAVNGTSFAAPIVAGVASLALSVDPSITPAALEALLKASTNSISTPYCNYYGCGSGIIDAYQVVDGLGDIWFSDEPDVKLVYPLDDGYFDSLTLKMSSRNSSNIVFSILTEDGQATAFSGQSISLSQSSGFYSGSFSLVPGNLAPGSYILRAAQGSNSESRAIQISSGLLQTITISKSSSSVYPYADGYRDSADITVTGKDESGIEIPVLGTVTIRNTFPIELTLVNQVATWNWASIPKGTQTITVTGSGPTGSTKSASSTILVAGSVATKATVSINSSTVYPIKDNYFDAASITMAITTNTGKVVPGNGTITVFQGSKKVASWKFDQTKLGTSKKTSVSWNGRINGKVKKGKFKIVASFKSSENGKTLSSTKTINVSDKKRVLKTKKGPWVSAKKAMNYCRGGWFSGCGYSGSAVNYYAYDWVDSEHRLPLPGNKSSIHSWRLKVNGTSTSLSYFALFICDDYYCDEYGDEQYFNGKSGKKYTWTSFYTKRGISDGHGDWALVGEDGYTFTAYKYQIEVRYWALV